MYTETMILLAMRQQKWNYAVEMFDSSGGDDFKAFSPAVENAVDRAKRGDVKAEYLLKIYSEAKWEKLDRK